MITRTILGEEYKQCVIGKIINCDSHHQTLQQNVSIHLFSHSSDSFSTF
jgi:hypothetical protein